MKKQSIACDFFVDNYIKIENNYNNGIFIEKLNLNKMYKRI